MYNIKNEAAVKNEPVTFAELNMKEGEVEEILRCSIDMLCNDDESMLIVGQQVCNEKNGISDLTAIDNKGNIVLIEIKRDRKDIKARKEPFEFQAIRYAASYATITSIDDLVSKVYSPYIEKNRKEFEHRELTSVELGKRKIDEFLNATGATKNFNEKQRIILVASDFDKQTLSAVAWLSSNDVDISCYKLIPYKIGEERFVLPEKLLPLIQYEDYYVNIKHKVSPEESISSNSTRTSLPKILDMLEWGIVKAGDIIIAKDKTDEATLLKNGKVSANGKEVSIQVWLKELYGWSSVATYDFAVHKRTEKPLAEMRAEYMLDKEAETSD